MAAPPVIFIPPFAVAAADFPKDKAKPFRDPSNLLLLLLLLLQLLQQQLLLQQQQPTQINESSKRQRDKERENKLIKTKGRDLRASLLLRR